MVWRKTKFRLQSIATEKHYEQIFKEMKEPEGKKSEEALLLVQKKHDLWRYHNESDEARRLQRSGSLRRMKKEVDSQDVLSFESCRSSAVDHVEEMSLESPSKMQDVQELMSETAGNAMRGRGEDAWRPERKRRRWKPESFRTGLKASTRTLMVKAPMNGEQVTNTRRQSHARRRMRRN